MVAAFLMRSFLHPCSASNVNIPKGHRWRSWIGMPQRWSLHQACLQYSWYLHRCSWSARDIHRRAEIPTSFLQSYRIACAACLPTVCAATTTATLDPSAITAAPVSVAKSITAFGLHVAIPYARASASIMALGIRVEHFDWLAVIHSDDIAGSVRSSRRHIFNRWDNAYNVDCQLHRSDCPYNG